MKPFQLRAEQPEERRRDRGPDCPPFAHTGQQSIHEAPVSRAESFCDIVPVSLLTDLILELMSITSALVSKHYLNCYAALKSRTIHFLTFVLRQLLIQLQSYSPCSPNRTALSHATFRSSRGQRKGNLSSERSTAWIDLSLYGAHRH